MYVCTWTYSKYNMDSTAEFSKIYLGSTLASVTKPENTLDHQLHIIFPTGHGLFY